MKSQTVQIMTIIVSVFASFVVCLYISLADIAPLLIFVILAAAAALAPEGHVVSPFTAVKLYTQKTE